MQFLKKIFNFYIFSNVHVALGVFCLTKITLFGYGVQGNTSAFFVFFSTIISYNFIRYYRVADIVSWFSDWMNSKKSEIFILIIISLVFIGIFAVELKLKAILWLLPFVLCTFFYVVPIPIFKESLRKIPGIKLFLIAISFAGATVLFPLVQNDIAIGYNEWIIFIQRFLFVVLITIPFDIRDLNCDDKSMKTLPQSIGIKNAKIIGVLFGLNFIILEFFKEPVVYAQVVIILIVTFTSSLFLIKANKIQTKYYSAFWVEAIPIFWWMLILGISIF